MTVTTAARAPLGEELRAAGEQAVRTFATISLVGALCGAFAVGVLGRLAMRLLAYLNPVATGVTSDDGFEIGQVTLAGSLQLAGAGIQIGLMGALGYAVLRGLMVGPPWFRLASISLGPGVVAGAMIVGPEGVDFRLLDPVWLAVALFVAVPTAYVALLSIVAERLLARRELPWPLLLVGLAVWVVVLPLVPLALAALAGVLALSVLRRTRAGERLLGSPIVPWVLRCALAAVFVWAVADLAADAATLS